MSVCYGCTHYMGIWLQVHQLEFYKKHWISNENIEFHPSGKICLNKNQVCFRNRTWWNCSQIPIWVLDRLRLRASTWAHCLTCLFVCGRRRAPGLCLRQTGRARPLAVSPCTGAANPIHLLRLAPNVWHVIILNKQRKPDKSEVS